MNTSLDIARDALSASRRALPFAWRSLVRQPARSTLGIVGVAAVGALLFDMVLLSQGLVLSMRDLLDRTGFDIRVASSDPAPGRPDIVDGLAVTKQIAGLPSVRSAVAVRTEDADVLGPAAEPMRGAVVGVAGGTVRPWTILRGTDGGGDIDIVINERAAQTLHVEPGAAIQVKAYCSGGAEAAPVVTFHVAGIAEFPFDAPEQAGAGTTMEGLAAACGTPEARSADVILVTSTGDPDETAADITALHLGLQAFTNDQAVGQLQQRGFTYFRQISTVLTTVTVAFALLLITVLLTVSVNQRLAEVAALRALGFSQRRVVLDVLCESALIVGIGGGLSLPLGAVLAMRLDAILKRMPGIPVNLHFFVFEPDALVIHVALLAATAILAAAYPMRIVARLPIATTLRNEVAS
jgi:putative ABC transport system permease protein